LLRVASALHDWFAGHNVKSRAHLDILYEISVRCA
jgi:hypothetical protein